MTDFYEKTTKVFDVLVYVNDTLQDITLDTVSIIFKKKKDDTDAEAVLSKDADVTTKGSEGIAQFTLTSTETDLEVRNYYYEIRWITSTGRISILESDSVRVLDRIYD